MSAYELIRTLLRRQQDAIAHCTFRQVADWMIRDGLAKGNTSILLEYAYALDSKTPLRPKWFAAPDWAQWWAYDTDAIATWFRDEPVLDPDGYWTLPGIDQPSPYALFDRDIYLPDEALYTTWQQSLRRRPQ